MNAEARSQIHQALLSRCHAIADHWYQAIARTNHVPHSAAEVRQRLVELTEETVALLLTEPFEHDRAEAIGALLAGLRYIEPEVLSRTQEVLDDASHSGLYRLGLWESIRSRSRRTTQGFSAKPRASSTSSGRPVP